MKSVCLKSPGDILLIDIPSQRRGQDEVLIKVRSAGICGSDIGAYKGVNPLVSYPRIIGHEIAGEVVEVDDDEKTFKVGDRVILEPYVYCGQCYPCSIGHTNCCENLTVRGVHIEGGMAEYVSHPRHLLHKVPDSIPWHLVPMAEPLVIGMHAVKQGETKAGQHVVITGAGQIGLLAAQYALTLGAIPIVVDPVDERLALARSLGVVHTLNPVSGDAVAGILSITQGRMAEVVIECSGAAPAIRGAVDYVSYAGEPESDRCRQGQCRGAIDQDRVAGRNAGNGRRHCGAPGEIPEGDLRSLNLALPWGRHAEDAYAHVESVLDSGMTT